MPDDKAPEQGQAVSTAQAAVQAQADQAQAQGAPEAGPFFEYTLPNGDKEVFKTKDELAKAYRDSFLRQSDYTRKTQEVAQTRKEHEAAVKKFQDEQKAFLDQKKRYDEWDRQLRERPDLMRALSDTFTRPMDPSVAFERAQGYTDEKYQSLMEKVEALEKQNQEDQNRREIDEAFLQLTEKYPDADKAAIMERLEMIADGKVGPLIEQLYWSAKGQLTPAQVEKAVVDNLKKKEGARLVPPTSAPAGAPPKFKDTKDARDAAFAAEGIVPG